MTDAEFAARARELIADIRNGDLHGLSTAPGMCQQFAGRFFTLVTGQHYLLDGQAGSAWAAYREMKQTGRGTELSKGDKLQPGDVLFWAGGDYGHVAIYVGGGRVIENTTSGRGEKVGPKTGNIRSGLDIRPGYHAMRLPFIKPAGPTRVIVQGKPVDIPLELRDNTHWVPMAAFADALGWKVTDHRHDTGKLECYPKEAQ